MALFPFAHATVSGLPTMVPPQATPVHPTSRGAAICITASYPAEVVAVLGIAMRIVSVLPMAYDAAYWEKVKPVSESIQTAESADSTVVTARGLDTRFHNSNALKRTEHK
jgi:hypothetical protein